MKRFTWFVAAMGASMTIVSAAQATLLTDFAGGSIAPGSSSYIVSPTMTESARYNVVSFDTIHPSWADFYDHTTGGPSGSSFMVVNGASGGGGGIAWYTSVSVTPGTDYEVGAWFASVYGFATSTLRIDVLGATVPTGPVFGAPPVTALWLQNTYAFNSGASTSVTIQIWDTSGLSDGNDYAIDDITLDVVPEPAFAGALALGALLTLRRRRRSA